MNELVYIKRNQVVCDSLQVAEQFGKQHKHVLRMIDELKENSSAQNWAQCFKKSTYKDRTGRTLKMYLMNRDGFSLLVMGFTGKKALEWKWKYIEAFNEMESFIREKHSAEWVEHRKTGKLSRRTETDVLKQLVEYAKAQGSKHADMIYMSYSQLANRAIGVKDRESATAVQLNRLELVESIIAQVVLEGIAGNLHYKQIYQNCKNRIEMVRELAYWNQEVKQ